MLYVRTYIRTRWKNYCVKSFVSMLFGFFMLYAISLYGIEMLMYVHTYVHKLKQIKATFVHNTF